MLVVATAASVVASQALISGVFSIMRQVCVCVCCHEPARWYQQPVVGHQNSIASRTPTVLGMRIACKLCELTVQDKRRYRLLKSCHR